MQLELLKLLFLSFLPLRIVIPASDASSNEVKAFWNQKARFKKKTGYDFYIKYSINNLLTIYFHFFGRPVKIGHNFSIFYHLGLDFSAHTSYMEFPSCLWSRLLTGYYLLNQSLSAEVISRFSLFPGTSIMLWLTLCVIRF